jgi:hypothetical protein
MQFGRFNGLMLIVLGLLLPSGQAWLKVSTKPPVERPPVEVTQPEHKTPPIMGVIGAVSLMVGVGLYLTNRRGSSVRNPAA